VPSDPNETKLPAEALEAFLDGILEELKSPADPAALDIVRSAFRKRVPLTLRSYAAAALILRAAGLSRPPTRAATAGKSIPAKSKTETKGRIRPTEDRKTKPGKKEKEGGKRKEKAERADALRPGLPGESATIFFSMGKRQRFFPRALADLVTSKAGLGAEEIGEVRSFDNYTFVDISLPKAGAVVSALDGTEYRGRRISVSLAKKRDTESKSG
jgi:hypothetical protein